MTIDDFDVNEISDKLSIREENEDSPAFQVGHNDGFFHDDGHNDFVPCGHDDASNPPFHFDHSCGHDDGHNDIGNHDDAHDDACGNPLEDCG